MAAPTSSNRHDGKAYTEKKTFSRQTSVGIDIRTEPAIVWALLTNAGDFPRWNTTIINLEGDIAAGQTIRLKSTLDPKRSFKLKVTELVPEKKMIWSGGMGQRLYTLNFDKGVTHFTMSEKIGGPLFPLFAKMIPPFDQAFEQFAADLKKEAELIDKRTDAK